jgi:hypothetical protein
MMSRLDGAHENMSRLTSLREHPRAAPAIRRAKGLGGLAGFLISALAGFEQGAPFAATVTRALIGGAVVYLLTWAAAVAIWRRVLTAQATAAIERARQRGSLTQRDAE